LGGGGRSAGSKRGAQSLCCALAYVSLARYGYINPMRHGFVGHAHVWHFLSSSRRGGLFPEDWADDFDAVREFEFAEV
jgi:hypothetical protein